jgi:hypothetical protein
MAEAKAKAGADTESDESRHDEDMAAALTRAKQMISEHKLAEARLEQQIAELAAAYEQLKTEVSQKKQKPCGLDEDYVQLEQFAARQVTQLAAAGRQLQQEVARRIELEHRLGRQKSEFTASINPLLANICKFNRELSLYRPKTDSKRKPKT